MAAVSSCIGLPSISADYSDRIMPSADSILEQAPAVKKVLEDLNKATDFV
ncbi:MAG: hypothetical protein LBD32_01785 [Cytophagales bacterium]|nr:hypothetical protein [Cytophagales bacterium]